MGILDRLSRLLNANVNDLIDRAEDPEMMIDQLLREMQENIATARQQVALMIAQEKELQADFDEVRHLATEWNSKAERAVGAGRDDLGREALRRKRDNDENARVYEQQLTAQREAVEKLKGQLNQLESKYQSTLTRRDSLIARHRRASAQQQVTASLSNLSPLDPSNELDRMERRIRGNESMASASIELGDESYDSQFAAIDSSEIDDELAALKARVQPNALPSQATTPEGSQPAK